VQDAAWPGAAELCFGDGRGRDGFCMTIPF
jgi:hypothetical protein